MYVFDRVGVWLQSQDAGVLGVIAVVAAVLALAGLNAIFGRLLSGVGKLDKSRVYRVKVEEYDRLEPNEVKLSPDLFDKLPWLSTRDPLRLLSYKTNELIYFDRATGRMTDKHMTVFVNPGTRIALATHSGDSADIKFKHAAPFSPLGYLHAAFTSAARRSELILGFWFVVGAFALERAWDYWSG